MPDGFLDFLKGRPSSPLWDRCLAHNPLPLLPPPATSPPKWSILPPSGRPVFDGDAFGDGSGRAFFGPRSARAAFGVVQVSMVGTAFRVAACVFGPLLGYVQTVPRAELAACLFYLQHLLDAPGRQFFTDCATVADGFTFGLASMVGASVANADLWRQILAHQNKRRYPITAVKVAAHATEAMVLEGYPPFLRHGNSLADAAAKLGLTEHPRDRDLEADVKYMEMMIREIAKFHGRVLEESRAAADDVPPIVPKPPPP